MQEEPALSLSPIGWNIRDGLYKYADFVYKNKWVIEHLNNIGDHIDITPDDFVRFIMQLEVYELSVGGNTVIFGTEVFNSVEKWENIQIELQNWICELKSVFINYPQLEEWFWWQIEYGIDIELTKFNN